MSESSFPGPQKNKMEFFIAKIYGGNKNNKLSKQEIMDKVRPFQFAPDVQVFFEGLPGGQYTEQQLIDKLNAIITSRGRAHAIGGTLQRLNQIPPEWETAYQDIYEQH